MNKPFKSNELCRNVNGNCFFFWSEISFNNFDFDTEVLMG